MLRISLSQTSDAVVVVKLEGKLLADWGNEVSAAFERACALRPAAVRLDLSDLSFADDAGTRLIRSLIGRGVALSACSNFVAELLQTEPV